MRSRMKVVVGSVLVASLLAACGDDDDDATDTTSGASPSTSAESPDGTTESTSGSESSTPGSSTPAGGSIDPDKDPIQIGVVGSFSGPGGYDGSEILEGVEVAVEGLNDRGGINGAEVQIVSCNDEIDAAKASACFRQMADDEDVVALVGGGTPNIVASQQVITEAQLPIIGPIAATIEASDPLAAITNGGSVGDYRGMALSAARAGQRVAYGKIDLPTFDVIEGLLREVITQNGAEFVGVVPVSLTTVDVAPIAAAMVENDPDVIIIGSPEVQAVSLIRQLRQDGYTGTIVIDGTPLLADFLDTLEPGLTENLIGVSSMAPIQVPDVQVEGLGQMLDEVEQYNADMRLTGYGTNSWLAVQLFAAAAQTVDGDITRQNLLQAVRSLSNFDTGGITPVLDYSTPGPVPNEPNNPNPTYAEMVAQDGRWTWDGTFINYIDGTEVTAS